MKAAAFRGSLVEADCDECKQRFNVLIAYDDVAAALRAMRLFSYLEREHGEGLKLEAKCWRFDLLEDDAWLELAVEEGIKADLLILSASSKSELPAAVQGWIKACLVLKRGSEAAVVGLFGTEEEMDQAASGLQFLRRATEKCGLVFFAPRPTRQHAAANFYGHVQQFQEVIDKNHEEAFPTNPGGVGKLPLPLPGGLASEAIPYRHWGINE